MITARSAENLSNTLLTLAKMKQEKAIEEQKMNMMAPMYQAHAGYFNNVGNARETSADALAALNAAKIKNGVGLGGPKKGTATSLSGLSPLQLSQRVTMARKAYQTYTDQTNLGVQSRVPKGADPLAWSQGQFYNDYPELGSVLKYTETPEGKQKLNQFSQ
jgi:hypothetical protein